MALPLAPLLRAFPQRFGHEATVVSRAPGRVNLIGEHTDYNQGHVLPVAIDRAVAVLAAPGTEGGVRAHSAEFEEGDEFALDSIEHLAEGGWRNYLRGVAWALREAAHSLRGLDLLIAGDVPIGAGLSSSAALEVALAGAFRAAGGLHIDDRDLALLAQRAENEFVGVQCGVMDQLAAVFGRRDHALLIDCRSLDVETLPLALERRGLRLVVVDSGVSRALGESAYNERQQECGEAAAALGLTALRDLDAATLESRRLALPAPLFRRARHVVSEEARVLAAAEALRRGEIEALGPLLFESHASLRDDFSVSCPELDLLVELAARTEAVLGARLTGAGFGGCTLNLVRAEALPQFQRRVVRQYARATGLSAAIYACRPARGLRVTRV